MKKSLVILTDRLGLNFSGGAIATCRIFELFQHEFQEIIVIAHQVGVHNFLHLRHLRYRSIFGALKHLGNLKKKPGLIFYGDFYMAYYFILAGVPFYFTYHDNWPAQKKLNTVSYVKSFFYIPVYQWIFKKATALINVSDYSYAYNAAMNKNNFLIRNGINTAIHKTRCEAIVPGQVVRIMMSGNIDERKFGLADMLFDTLQTSKKLPPLEIHIYGHPQSTGILKKLSRYNFVKLMGFSREMDFSPYQLFLSVSQMENLSIAVCEALANHTPVVAFDVGGLSEVVKNGKNGFLIEKFDICAMAVTLNKIVQGQIRFQFAKDNLLAYNWNLAANRYREILIPESSKK